MHSMGQMVIQEKMESMGMTSQCKENANQDVMSVVQLLVANEITIYPQGEKMCPKGTTRYTAYDSFLGHIFSGHLLISIRLRYEYC